MNEATASLLSHPRTLSPVDLLLGMTLLALVPVLAVSVTSFTRLVVVLSLLRSSFGAASLPPTIVIVALAIMLTGVIMFPTISRIKAEAVQPYLAHRLTIQSAFEKATQPLETFMLKQTRASDVRAFSRIAHAPAPGSRPALFVLAPAFLVSELRTAFAMGFALALPFAVIDIVVAIVLMSLGMFMISPATISLPVKLLLFVAADGWTLVVGALVSSFH